MSLSSNPKKHRRIFYLMIAIVAVTSVVYWYERDIIKLQYYNLRYNHYQNGDRIVLVHNVSIPLKVMVVPVDPNTGKKSFLIDSKLEINIDSLKKYHTDRIGVYYGHKILPWGIENMQFLINCFIIKPNKKFIRNKVYGFEVPPGYQLTKGPLYVQAAVSHK